MSTNNERKKHRNIIVEEALSRLSDYYPYDAKTRTFTMTYRFKHASDILVDPSQVTNRPKVRKSLIDEIIDSVGDFPKGYYVHFDIHIDDLEDSRKEDLILSFRDAVLFKHYQNDISTKTSRIKAGFLVLLGMFFIVLTTLGYVFGWWGGNESFYSDIILGFLNVFGCVFIWEAVSSLVIRDDPYRSTFLRIARKIKSISVTDKRGHSITKNIIDAGYPFRYYRARDISHILILFASFSLIGLALVGAIQLLLYLGTDTLTLTPLQVVFWIVASVSMAINGALGILIYRGGVHLMIPAGIIGVTLAVGTILYFVLALIRTGIMEAEVTALFCFLVNLFYCVGIGIKAFLYLKRKVR